MRGNNAAVNQETAMTHEELQEFDPEPAEFEDDLEVEEIEDWDDEAQSVLEDFQLERGHRLLKAA
jgi:hypothetical protein